MKFTETDIKGAFIIEPEKFEDERGFFARLYTPEEFKRMGLKTSIAQIAVSYNQKKGTLRGMHFQVEPHAQAKVVRCTAGAIYDVVIDLRKESKTYCHWISVELNAENRKSLYVPEGLAHGFQTLEDGSEVLYQITESYQPGLERGIRWDDPVFKIKWPIAITIISSRDQSFKNF